MPDSGAPPFKILVADDDVSINHVMRTLLENSGYNAISAFDGAEALEKASLHRPDLVVLDIMMPELHGISVCEKIKADRALRNTKVLICSVKTYSADQNQAREAGADGFIGKPCDVATLLERIEETLRS